MDFVPTYILDLSVPSFFWTVIPPTQVISTTTHCLLLRKVAQNLTLEG